MKRTSLDELHERGALAIAKARYLRVTSAELVQKVVVQHGMSWPASTGWAIMLRPPVVAPIPGRRRLRADGRTARSGRSRRQDRGPARLAKRSV